MKQRLRHVFRSFLAVGLIICVAYVLGNYWAYIFSKTVIGKVVRVERVTQISSMINVQQVDPSQLYSFALAIRDDAGEIWTASSEDRQWAVVQADQCVEAKFYPYPPWNLEKSGTYANARLKRMFDCPMKENTKNSSQ